MDELTLDRSFVRDLLRTSADRATVRAAIALGHDLELAVAAERVEDLPTLQPLRSLGGDLPQAYTLSRPPGLTPVV